MVLTRSFRELVQKRLGEDPEFGAELSEFLCARRLKILPL